MTVDRTKVYYKLGQSGCGAGYGCRSFYMDRYHATVCYSVGMVSVPRKNCGPLAVFDSLENAKKFAPHLIRSLTGLVLYSCYITPSLHETLWFDSTCETNKDAFPTGTVLADEVELIEEVKFE